MKVRFRFILNVTFFLLSKIIVEGKRIGVITITLEVQYAKRKKKKRVYNPLGQNWNVH